MNESNYYWWSLSAVLHYGSPNDQQNETAHILKFNAVRTVYCIGRKLVFTTGHAAFTSIQTFILILPTTKKSDRDKPVKRHMELMRGGGNV